VGVESQHQFTVLEIRKFEPIFINLKDKMKEQHFSNFEVLLFSFQIKIKLLSKKNGI
jgi:hypothetical protein